MRRGYRIMAVALLGLAGPIDHTLAQDRAPDKGSAAHIRAVTGKVDGAAIQANARTARDWLVAGGQL